MTKRSAVVLFISSVAAGIFSGDKHLVSGVALRVVSLGNRTEFLLKFDDDAKDYKIDISQVNLYLRKMTVSEIVYSAVESTLPKTTAIYRYTEIIP